MRDQSDLTRRSLERGSDFAVLDRLWEPAVRAVQQHLLNSYLFITFTKDRE